MADEHPCRTLNAEVTFRRDGVVIQRWIRLCGFPGNYWYCGHDHDLWALDLFSGAGGSAMGPYRREEPRMSHTCPGPGCRIPVRDDQLSCRTHWFQVPSRIRNAVYAAWQGGYGAGSPEHADAMAAAIKYMRPAGSSRG